MSSNHWAILKGSNSLHYLTAKKSRIGRDANCNDVILLSQSISKQHCVLNGSDLSNIIITDYNSRNGTFVNGQRIQNATIKIKHGDNIRFGFDSNCYRIELANKPPISSAPPIIYRFDNQRRHDDNRKMYKSHSVPANLQSNNNLTRTPSYLKGENRSAGFMMGSPPTSPNKFVDRDLASSTVQPDDLIENDANFNEESEEKSEISQSQKQSIPKNWNHDEMEMRSLKDAMLRLEDKINTIQTISKENNKQLNDTILSSQTKNNILPDTLPFNTPINKQKYNNNPNYPALISKETAVCNSTKSAFDEKKIETLKELQKKECEEKMQQFYDSVEKLSIDKSLQLLNMKIQFLVHLFKSADDFHEQVPNFLDFSTRYKQQQTQTLKLKNRKGKADDNKTPSLTDFVKLLEYLNDIFDANQCTEISEYISSTKSEILLYRHKEKNDNKMVYNRAIQIDDTERDNHIALAHSMKEYSNTLQVRLYQLKQILISKDEKINELGNKDWIRKLELLKNRNCSLNRQLMIKEKDLKRLYKMFSELSQRIDINLPDSTILRSKINDFIKSYNSKIFHLSSQLSELNRRKNEKNKKWSDINEKCRRHKNKINNLESIIKTQRETFTKTLQEKDLALIKANKQLSILAGLNGTSDQEKAAKFLFETLQKYISENDKFKASIETLETSLQIKINEIESLSEEYQNKLDQLRKNDNIQQLQQELKEERQHYGAERISKLEKMLFELQTNLAEKTEKLINIQDENRKLSEKAPLDQVETIEFLSKTVHEKDEHINKLQKIIDSQTIKIKELNMIQETLKNQTEKHHDEIQDIQEKHQRVNNILGNMKTMQTIAIKDPDSNNKQNEWIQNEIIDHDIDVSVSNQL